MVALVYRFSQKCLRRQGFRHVLMDMCRALDDNECGGCPGHDVTSTFKKLRFGSWNLAGMCKTAVLETFQSVVQFDVMAIQEFPKAAAGWHHVQAEAVEGWVYQDVLTYRGIGIMFRPGKVILL